MYRKKNSRKKLNVDQIIFCPTCIEDVQGAFDNNKQFQVSKAHCMHLFTKKKLDVNVKTSLIFLGQKLC